jgi:hypothetical protein
MMMKRFSVGQLKTPLLACASGVFLALVFQWTESGIIWFIGSYLLPAIVCYRFSSGYVVIPIVHSVSSLITAAVAFGHWWVFAMVFPAMLIILLAAFGALTSFFIFGSKFK